jgi:hypothetical protein
MIACFVALLCSTGSAQLLKFHHSSHATQEQLVFSAEDKGVQEPVGIPDSIKPMLAADEYVKSLLDAQKLTAARLPSAWFSVAQTHLCGRKELDLLVVGEPPVKGADGTTFWVFCATPRGYSQALKVSTHTLLVKEPKSRGARELEAKSGPAADVFSVMYRYDGLEYKSYKEASAAIK